MNVSGMSLRLQPAETAAAQNRIHLSARTLLRTLADLCPVNKIAFDRAAKCRCGYHTAVSADNGRTTSLLSWFVVPPSLFTTCFRTASDPVRVNFSGWRRTAINLTAASNPIYGIYSAAEEAAIFLINSKQAHLPTLERRTFSLSTTFCNRKGADQMA